MTTGPAEPTLQLDGQKPLDDGINWYRGKSQSVQTWFEELKMVRLVTAGINPPPGIFNIPQRGIDLAGRI
jgi:hypothetical protein